MFRERGSDPRGIGVRVVVDATPHQRLRVRADDIDDERSLREVRLIWIRLPPTPAAADTLLYWPAHAIDSVVDASYAALDDQCRLVRRLCQATTHEGCIRRFTENASHDRRVEHGVFARDGHRPDRERPERGEVHLFVDEDDVVIGENGAGYKHDENNTTQSDCSHGRGFYTASKLTALSGIVRDHRQ